MALGLYVEVELEERAQGLLVEPEGEGAELPTGASHLAAQVACKILGHDRVALRVRSEIPVARGLGSSAALAVAAAAAAGVELGSEGAFRCGAAFDGHAENAAAAAFGGLVTATLVEDRPVALPLPLDPALGFVLVVPDNRLFTAAARDVLPEAVRYEDAVFNLGRLGLLVAGLADHTKLLAGAGDDRLHQPARSALFPQAPALLEGLREAGALTSCWSGAGPSLLAITTRASCPDVAEAARQLMGRLRLAGRALELKADLEGVQVKQLA